MFNLEEGEVAGGVLADEPRGVFGVVVQTDGDLAAGGDNMRVGDDESVFGDEKAGADGGGGRISVLFAEEIFQPFLEGVLVAVAAGNGVGRGDDGDGDDGFQARFYDVSEAVLRGCGGGGGDGGGEGEKGDVKFLKKPAATVTTKVFIIKTNNGGAITVNVVKTIGTTAVVIVHIIKTNNGGAVTVNAVKTIGTTAVVIVHIIKTNNGGAVIVNVVRTITAAVIVHVVKAEKHRRSAQDSNPQQARKRENKPDNPQRSVRNVLRLRRHLRPVLSHNRNQRALQKQDETNRNQKLPHANYLACSRDSGSVSKNWKKSLSGGMINCARSSSASDF